MLVSCPVCRARLRKGTACYRCKTDLTDLYLLQDRARLLLRRARVEYRRAAYPAALAAARASLAACRTEEGRELEVLLLFRLGHRHRAFAAWQQGGEGGSMSRSSRLNAGEGKMDDSLPSNRDLGMQRWSEAQPLRPGPFMRVRGWVGRVARIAWNSR